jgi:hypothetical protein
MTVVIESSFQKQISNHKAEISLEQLGNSGRMRYIPSVPIKSIIGLGPSTAPPSSSKVFASLQC